MSCYSLTKIASAKLEGISAFKQDSRYLSEMWSAALLVESYPITQHSLTRGFGSGEALEFRAGHKRRMVASICSINAVWDRSSSVPRSSSTGLHSQQAALGSFCCFPSQTAVKFMGMNSCIAEGKTKQSIRE